jgi:hypothetical protein
MSDLTIAIIIGTCAASAANCTSRMKRGPVLSSRCAPDDRPAQHVWPVR